MDIPNPFVTSTLQGICLTFGNLAVWVGLASAISCVVFYWTAMLRTVRRPAAAVPLTGSNGSTNGHTNGKKNGKDRPKGARSGHGNGHHDPYELKSERIERWGRRCFIAASACMVVGSLCLWGLIFGQQFNVAYIAKNSNPELPFGYRFASFWSDQQGTFLLWGLYNAVIGAVFLWRCKPDARWVMPFFGIINVSLFTLLTFMNPFWLAHTPRELADLLRSYNAPEQLISILPTTTWGNIAYYFGWGQHIDPKLVNARGLNESLQNFWMVIHPPTLFVGYSTLIIPSCFALGALMRRDYDTWVNRAAPWLVFSWGVLGTGIFLGAYWAYETLGWGGYWMWDPVENASLIPWIVATALLHGLLAQRNRGNFKQANLFLGVMTGASLLLGSFLVRSGVLEGSVHSFATPQKSVFFTLVAVMALWFFLGSAIWIWRFRDIQAEIAYQHVWERHFGFFLGLIVVTMTALVIAFGVTAPIWKPMFSLGREHFEHTFYNKALLPVAFVMMLLIAITPLMPWKRARDESRPMKPFNIAVLGIAGLLTLLFVFAAVNAWKEGFRAHNATPPSFVNDPIYLAFAGALALAMVTNLVCLVRAARGGITQTGPWLAHIGFAVLLGGVLITTRYKEIHSFTGGAPLGQPVTALGREFIFRGERKAANPQDRDRMVIDMRTPDGKTRELAPKFFISNQSGEPQRMGWPVILHEGLDDVYIVPSSVDNTNSEVILEVAKGSTKATEVQRTPESSQDVVAVTFNGIDTSELQALIQSPESGKEPVVYGEVVLNINGVEKKVRPAARVILEEGGMKTEPIPLPIDGLRQDTPYTLLFQTNMEPGNLTADFAFKPDKATPRADFQVMKVPGIQVLWWGAYLMMLGAFLTWLKRRKLADKPVATGSRGAAPGLEVKPAREPVAAE
jgi:cytochrome c-type biogenesis protein CcmF